MNKQELIQAIMAYLMDNSGGQRVRECHDHFGAFIFGACGEYLANGREISSFIYEADRLLYNTL